MTPGDLHKRRVELGLTRSQLAGALEVDEAEVLDWEMGAEAVPDGAATQIEALLTSRHERIQRERRGMRAFLDMIPPTDPSGAT